MSVAQGAIARTGETEVPHSDIKTVVFASSLGTVIEWYDFFLYGSLAVFFGTLFFPPGNELLATIASLSAFATGYLVRPIGALLWGSIGDRLGRKKAFVLTLIMMGVSTTLIGFLPTYASVGIVAPLLLVALRLVQGIAMAGEYGGAVVYVGEHSPGNRRGYYTSFIQTTATLGLFLAIIVIMVTRLTLGDAAFKEWGWRVPFMASAVLVLFSMWMRIKLDESPVFEKMRAEGKVSRSPVKESFGNRKGFGLFLLTLFGLTAGLGSVWHCAQFYALYFVQGVLKLDFLTANICVAAALIIGTPFYVIFGALSDRIGRRKIMVTGLILAALLIYPIYAGIAAAAVAKNFVLLSLLIAGLIVIAAMVYGPTAAFLVEFYPPELRYTSLSLPYHVGTAVVGGLGPIVGLSLVAWTGDILAGVYYPIAVAAITAIVNLMFMPSEKRVESLAYAPRTAT